MKLPSIPLLVLDTETTGFVPKVHHVIEFAGQRFENGTLAVEYEQLIRCDVPVPPHIERLTHIATVDLANKPAFAEVLPAIQALVTPDTLIVGQNVLFDIGMLKGEGWNISGYPWIDTAMLASIAFPEQSSYSLGYLSRTLKLDHAPKHRALGDVRATVQLLGKCIERLEQLPAKDMEVIKVLAARGPAGYRLLFDSFTSSEKTRPKWLISGRRKVSEIRAVEAVRIDFPAQGSLQIIEEPLRADWFASLLHGLKTNGKPVWVAVKNLEAVLRRTALPQSTSIFLPPELLCSQTSIDALLMQQALTNDELTLAIKCHLYAPTSRADLPIHGEEYGVWNGKIAANIDSPEYKHQFDVPASIILIDHTQLLTLILSAETSIPAGSRIIIDDASMLEDTATHAYGWICSLKSLRAGAQGDDRLMKFADLLELWMEKVRSGADLRYIVASDLETPEAKGLKSQLQDILSDSLPRQIAGILSATASMLESDNLVGRFQWIETFIDGSKSMKSVPENVAHLLKQSLFAQHAVTLLMPPLAKAPAHAIIDRSLKPEVRLKPRCCALRIDYPTDWQMQTFILDGTGKTVLLMSSKRSIEDLFVRYSQMAEAHGITLLCQGMSGGQSRMQAEFAQAPSPAVLVTTPWTYETYELPEGTVSTLIVQSLPFDHPSHAVISRRSQMFSDPFNEYCLPRLKHRLFRIMKTFCRHATERSSVLFLDDRLRTKGYGKEVRAYIDQLVPDTSKGTTKDGQLSLL